jgi:hypothetical protein
MAPNTVPCTLFSSVLEEPFRKDPTLHSYEKKGKIMVMNSPRDSVLYGVKEGAHGGAAGWSTALQRGRSRILFSLMSLDFFIGIIILFPLWPSDRLRR